MDRPSASHRKIAIVTGGSSGIGRATVVELARRGYDVGFTYRARAAAARDVEATVRDHGQRVASGRVDLADAAAGATAVERLAGALGGAPALFVSNAATNTRGGVLDQSLESWRHTFEVNLHGAFACGQAAARMMRGRGGAIVNVSSVVGRVPLRGAAAYSAAKAGLDMLTRVMAYELAPHGIRVNGVAPGQTATPMNYGEEAVDAHSVAVPAIPLGRPADPAELARAIAFIGSDDASYATGTTLLVDGGLALVSGPSVLDGDVAIERPVDPVVAERR